MKPTWIKPAQPNREANELTPDRSWVSQPNGSQEIVHPVARPAPTIRGELIDAQLRRNAEGLSAKNLSVIGGVEVLHQIETGGQSLPARLTGQRLQLVDGGGADILQLVSDDNTPARFELGDGYFVGPEIQVRPADNVVWINAAGEFQMPSSVLPEGIGNEPRRRPLLDGAATLPVERRNAIRRSLGCTDGWYRDDG